MIFEIDRKSLCFPTLCARVLGAGVTVFGDVPTHLRKDGMKTLPCQRCIGRSCHNRRLSASSGVAASQILLFI